jgi:hypothetical protein
MANYYGSFLPTAVSNSINNFRPPKKTTRYTNPAPVSGDISTGNIAFFPDDLSREAISQLTASSNFIGDPRVKIDKDLERYWDGSLNYKINFGILEAQNLEISASKALQVALQRTLGQLRNPDLVDAHSLSMLPVRGPETVVERRVQRDMATMASMPNPSLPVVQNSMGVDNADLGYSRAVRDRTDDAALPSGVSVYSGGSGTSRLESLPRQPSFDSLGDERLERIIPPARVKEGEETVKERLKQAIKRFNERVAPAPAYIADFWAGREP